MIIGSVNSEIIKILFNTTKENLFLGDIIKVINKDNAGILAQVVKIDSSKDKPYCNVASCKIMFTLLPESKIVNWKGNVPSRDNIVSILSDKEICTYIDSNDDNNASIGYLTLYNGVRFDFSIDSLKKPTLIFCDKQEQRINTSLLLSQEIAENGKKAVLIDFRGEYSDIDNVKRLTAGRDFKLPLDSKGIDLLYERTLINASAETRAVIEDIFMSVQEYADESEEKFIPFLSFKQVVEDEYDQSHIPELVLLKNRLTKLDKEGIFANNAEEINAFGSEVADNNCIILDLSKVPSFWHRDYIDFIVSANIERYNQKFFFVLEVIDKNFDDELLNKFYISGIKSGAYPIVLAGYGSKYAGNIMVVTKNLVFFSPKIQTDKFPEFNCFINRLDFSEALIVGDVTKSIPLFVQVDQFAVNSENDDVETVEPQNFEKEFTDEVVVSAQDQPVYFDGEDEFYEHYEEQGFDEQEEPAIESDINETEELPQDQFDDLEELYSNKKQEQEFSNFEEFSEINEEPENSDNAMPTPDIPVYSAAEEIAVKEFDLKEGDNVRHQKYGDGIIKKIIGYGNKKLCSIEFVNVGRRLLDPSLAVIEKI